MTTESNMDQDIIQRLNFALPAVRSWIEKTLEDHKHNGVPVITLGFSRLEKVFSSDLLKRAKVIAVTEKIPYPPVSSMGLPELQQMETTPFSGITFKDTFFVREDMMHSESIHFHELVHVVQWDQLGVNNFLLAYAAGLIQFGYENSPFEQMAYKLQRDLDSDNLSTGLEDLIRVNTGAIWAGLAHLFKETSAGDH